MIEFENENEYVNPAVIKVVGIGGGGSNAVKRMIEAELRGVQFYVVNTDLQALRSCRNAEQIQIGAELTHGLGAGSNPEIGQQAARDDSQKLESIVDGSDMIFITAGMGGGTGTGAAPVIAQLAKSSGALTVAVVTRPFIFEGRRRAIQSEDGIAALREVVDALIVIPNQKLLEVVDRNTPIMAAFKVADDVLRQGVQSISDLITVPGEINLDFADVKTIMSETGGALMGIGEGTGESRAQRAAQKAISSPLLEESSISGATGVLVNVTGGLDMTLHEVEEALDVIYASVDEEAHVIFGLVPDPKMEEKIKVTVIATGFDSKQTRRKTVLGSEALDLDSLLNRNFDRNVLRGRSRAAKTQQTTTSREAAPGSRSLEEDFDIPTFLRIGRERDKKQQS